MGFIETATVKGIKTEKHWAHSISSLCTWDSESPVCFSRKKYAIHYSLSSMATRPNNLLFTTVLFRILFL